MTYCSWYKVVLSIVFVFFLSRSMEENAHAPAFATHAEVNFAQQVFSYTVFNDKPTGSAFYATNFTLSLPNEGSFNVTETPSGWAFSTDDTSYVYWYNTDASLPYPNDIAPGQFLSGFSIQSTVPSTAQPIPDEIDAWDHSQDAPGPIVLGTVLGPQADLSAVPEPAFYQMGVLLLLGGIGMWRLRRSKA